MPSDAISSKAEKTQLGLAADRDVVGFSCGCAPRAGSWARAEVEDRDELARVACLAVVEVEVVFHAVPPPTAAWRC